MERYSNETPLPVRCVSDVEITGWTHDQQESTCTNWEDYWWQSVFDGDCLTLDYHSAVALCDSFGARLPTLDEVVNWTSCSWNDEHIFSCSWNDEHIWTSTSTGTEYYSKKFLLRFPKAPKYLHSGIIIIIKTTFLVQNVPKSTRF